MVERNQEQKHSPLTVRMRIDFEDFTEEKQENVIRDLARLGGCFKTDIRNVVFRTGCTILEGDFPNEAIERIIKLFSNCNSIDNVSDYEEMKKFIAAYQVAKITDGAAVVSFSIKTEITKKRQRKGDALIYLHGWKGDSTTFGNLPTYVKKEISCEYYVYPYPTGWLSHSPSLIHVARNLDNTMRLMFKDVEKLAFVAHSMGGLILRYLITNQIWEEADDRLDSIVSQMTFVASPFDGAVLANLADYAPGLGSPQIEELKSGSGFLVDLNSKWLKWSKNHAQKQCRIRSIYGTNDNVVSSTNAQGLDANAVPLLGANHTDIVKPKTENDEIVKYIVSFLREAEFGKNSDFKPALPTSSSQT